MSVTAGTDQHGPPNAELPAPITVVVVDAANLENGAPAPVAGQVVNWVVTEGGGSVFAPVTTTNSEGKAFQRWTLGASGPQSLEARAIDSTGAKVTYQTVAATIDVPPPPTVSSVTVSPRAITSWAGNENPPFTVTVKDGTGATNTTIPVTVVSRNPSVGRVYEGTARYAGPEPGTTYYVFTAGDKQDSLQITTTARDTSLSYRASAPLNNYQPAPDTSKFWYSAPIQGTYYGDSAVKVFALWTFPDYSASTPPPYDPSKGFLCKATYTITVSSGEVGPLHAASGGGRIYPGCDPYAIYTFQWKVRAKDVPVGTLKPFTITICPVVEHPVCSVQTQALNEI